VDNTIDHDTQAALNKLEARIAALEENAGIAPPDEGDGDNENGEDE